MILDGRRLGYYPESIDLLLLAGCVASHIM